VPTRIRSHRRLPRPGSAAALLALGLAGLTACGGSDSGSDSASGTTSESASTSSSAESSASDPSSSASNGSASNGSAEAEAEAITATEADFSISLDEETLKAGTYAITVVNNGNATHDLAVEEDGTTKATSDKIGPGESTTLTVDLDAGEYVFFCSIGNHRAMGMELTVQVT
jgi:plastocyanin